MSTTTTPPTPAGSEPAAAIPPDTSHPALQPRRASARVLAFAAAIDRLVKLAEEVQRQSAGAQMGVGYEVGAMPASDLPLAEKDWHPEALAHVEAARLDRDAAENVLLAMWRDLEASARLADAESVIPRSVPEAVAMLDALSARASYADEIHRSAVDYFYRHEEGKRAVQSAARARLIAGGMTKTDAGKGEALDADEGYVAFNRELRERAALRDQAEVEKDDARRRLETCRTVVQLLYYVRPA